jgi:hypothetical protein
MIYVKSGIYAPLPLKSKLTSYERIKQIINEKENKALTIAAVQPTVIDDRNKNEQVLHQKWFQVEKLTGVTPVSI